MLTLVSNYKNIIHSKVIAWTSISFKKTQRANYSLNIYCRVMIRNSPPNVKSKGQITLKSKSTLLLREWGIKSQKTTVLL